MLTPSRRAGLLAAFALMVLIAACADTPPTPADSSGPAPTVAAVDLLQEPVSAAELLRRMAGTITVRPADAKPAATFRYSYLHTQLWAPSPGAVVAAMDETRWRAADGTGRADTRRLREHRLATGAPTTDEQRRLATATVTTDLHVDEPWWSDTVTEPLPSDLTRLTTLLFTATAATNSPRAMLGAWCDLSRYHYLDRPVRATTLLILATVPGLAYDGIARDVTGRIGWAFRLDSTGSRDTTLLDPRTGALLTTSTTSTNGTTALISHVLLLTADRVTNLGDTPTTAGAGGDTPPSGRAA